MKPYDKRSKAYHEFIELRNHKLTMLGIGVFYLVLFIALGSIK